MNHRAFTPTERAEYMEAQGKCYAGRGSGLFSYYENAQHAFDESLKHKPLAQLNSTFTQEDFPAFEKGYNEYLAQLVAMRLIKVEADAVIRRILGTTAETGTYDELGNRIELVKHYTDLKGWQEANPEVTAEERAELVRRGLPPS